MDLGQMLVSKQLSPIKLLAKYFYVFALRFLLCDLVILCFVEWYYSHAFVGEIDFDVRQLQVTSLVLDSYSSL